MIYLDGIESKVKAIKQRQIMNEDENNEEELDKVMGGE